MRQMIVWLVLAGSLLAACGSSASPTPSSAAVSTTPSSAAASTTPSATTAPTPRPSPVVAAVCTPTPIKFDPKATIDLTGAWAGDDDGIYYLRQRGATISWNGMSDRNGPPALLGHDWNNVGRGEIQKDLSIAIDWADVPRGGIDGYGTMNLKIGPDSAGNIQITKVSETGTGFGNTVWTRCQPGFPL